jgi:tetratricopeptide (TPR) repeat protein
MLILALVVAAGLALHQEAAAGAWPAAERLARSGLTREALQQFQEIVRQHPDDVEARLWLARLQRRVGRSDLAEKEFRRVLGQVPDHPDAMIGLAGVLNARGAFEEASALLDRAEVLAPQSAEMLSARAQGCWLSGRALEAEAYYARALALTPGDSDIQRGLESTRRINRHRVEASFFAETAARSASGANGADVNIDFRATDRLRVNARMQAQSHVAQNDARAGGGLEWRLRRDVTLRGSTLIGPGADIIARSDTVGEVEYLRGRLETALGVRHMSFTTADVWVVAPSGTFWLTDRAAVSIRYYRSTTAFAGRPVVGTHAGAVRVRYSVHPRVWLDTAYSRGFERFEQLSADALGVFRADTFSGAVLYHLPRLQSLSAGIDYQRRHNGQILVRVGAAVVHRF